jgi:hypothetical protein
MTELMHLAVYHDWVDASVVILSLRKLLMHLSFSVFWQLLSWWKIDKLEQTVLIKDCDFFERENIVICEDASREKQPLNHHNVSLIFFWKLLKCIHPMFSSGRW